MERMKKQDRLKLILKKVKELKNVSVVDSEFVDWYINTTNAKCYITMIGANICKTLSRDLSYLYNKKKLDRRITGIHVMCGYGFPKWVYVYSIANRKEV